ncbi:hypothetical protein [Legionella impletisoli]|uniref:Uncharacterized protein n=1 Tax=Legionella impletisoli TaxID=343510 RepID=A0A917K0A3_9GAMM|nr:hypothetical protein [Legionella impletisoli]GGI93229.1 hypothetical protein GCM10007966_22240 [Legionella impletisoli]
MSSYIDFNPQKSLLPQLQTYFKTHADLENKFHIITPEVLPASDQRGETCKLKALADAMGHTAKATHSHALPLYKNREYGVSLRQIAKKKRQCSR